MAGNPSKNRKRPPAKKQKPRGNPEKAHVSRDPRRVEPATFRDWVGAARLRTLPLAFTPVLIGTGAAMLATGVFHWVIALACLVVAVSLQIGVNYANDYSDGVRGTDDHRVGPARLTASRRVKPRTVLTVALVFFLIAAVAGLAIVIRTQQWWLLLVGAVCLLAGVVLHGRQAPLRLLRPRRAVRLRVLRARRHARHDLGAGLHHARRRPGSAASPRGCWRAPCCWRTTCATSTRTGSRASAP